MFALVALVSYLIGSVPAAWLITWLLTGRDLRQMGSGNVGVMNTALSVSRGAGLAVLAVEIAKGIAAPALARAWVGGEAAPLVAALAMVAGTRWPIWLGGRGGRGNTSAMAALACLSWPSVLAVVIFWVLARWLAPNSFAAARLTLMACPALCGLMTLSIVAVAASTAFGLMFLTTHRPDTDDHSLLRRRWPSVWAFVTAPRLRRMSDRSIAAQGRQAAG